MQQVLEQAALDQLFNHARTNSHWLPREVSDETLQAVYNLARMGPTSANSSPARFVFVKSAEAKAKLKPALDAGNIEKTMAAPVTVIVGMDYAFYEQMSKLFHDPSARSWFEGKELVIHNTAFRNSSLQGAYLLMAARAMGLDCGPMSGFNGQLVDETFFAGTQIKSNFLINLGYGDPAKLHPRNPRLAFEEACSLL
ncbi:malonic semialdehyde reductase [Parachitinimonas caeni]|uniref:Putative NADH dehydrogenase/NAD(P)H nitroreductase PZA18_06040 n=1 Tax=Parachitinimonas caeni TaxID=3031301 RepID=A0ABT7DU54_9NEIS|nr:malonic semialdehyde reductase [Parachitinimonas caeni]MDK2123606.1 malonic semialdehyde reductase [Parachitinimonas caeni]